MNALVIGYGSIGSRHAGWLAELGCKVAVVSKRKIATYPVYLSIPTAFKAESYDYIVIANQTNEHYQAFEELANLHYQGMVLVEKPLFHSVKKIPSHSFKSVFVAYQLRLHPVVQKLQQIMNNEKILSVQAYVGQYLPTWRPQRDYRLNYSAHKSAGGGVLRDLSHELDYLNWLLGGWDSLVAVGGHYSHLEMDSEDVFNILLKTRLCPIVNIQLNYLDRTMRREIVINTDEKTIKVDLAHNKLVINDECIEFTLDRDDTYLALHDSVLGGGCNALCSAAEGMDVLHMIESAEQSAVRKVWIDR